jgi:hypothetical protein
MTDTWDSTPIHHVKPKKLQYKLSECASKNKGERIL